MSISSRNLSCLKIRYQIRKYPRKLFSTLSRNGIIVRCTGSLISVPFLTFVILIYFFSLVWISTKSFPIQDFIHAASIPPSIQNYITWHCTMRSCLAHSNCSEPPRIIVWRCPFDRTSKCSGLGDRFRGIQFSVLLAILTESVFFMEWPSTPLKITDVVEPSMIDWTVPDSLNLNDENWGTVAHYRWPDLNWIRCPLGVNCSSFTDHSSKVFSKLSRATNMASSDLRVELRKSRNIIIYTSATGDSTTNLMKNKKLAIRAPDIDPDSFGTMNLYKVLLRVLVKPSKLIFHELGIIGLSRAVGRNYLAAHVRTGADIGERNLDRFLSLPKFDVIARELLDCVQDQGEMSKLPLYFASDSLALKRKVVDEGKIRNIQILTGFGSAFHIAKAFQTSRNHSKKDLKMSFLNVFVEFFGISGGVRVIGNRSGFSKMAFYCGSASDYVRFTSSSKNSLVSCRKVQ